MLHDGAVLNKVRHLLRRHPRHRILKLHCLWVLMHLSLFAFCAANVWLPLIVSLRSSSSCLLQKGMLHLGHRILSTGLVQL